MHISTAPDTQGVIPKSSHIYWLLSLNLQNQRRLTKWERNLKILGSINSGHLSRTVSTLRTDWRRYLPSLLFNLRVLSPASLIYPLPPPLLTIEGGLTILSPPHAVSTSWISWATYKPVGLLLTEDWPLTPALLEHRASQSTWWWGTRDPPKPQHTCIREWSHLNFTFSFFPPNLGAEYKAWHKDTRDSRATPGFPHPRHEGWRKITSLVIGSFVNDACGIQGKLLITIRGAAVVLYLFLWELYIESFSPSLIIIIFYVAMI